MRSFYNIAEQRIEAQLLQRANKQLLIHGDQTDTISVKSLGDDEYRVNVNEQPISIYAIAQGDQFFIHLNGRHYLIECQDEAQSANAGETGADKTIATAPMPGTVVSVNVKPGQTVKENEALMVIESMKMETTITAWRDGEVANINYEVGDSFDRMAALIEFER